MAEAPGTRVFARTFDELPRVVAFTADAFARGGIDGGLRAAVDFAIEELFTNMVKYGRGSGAGVRVELSPIPDGVEVALTDYDVEPFDVTKAPDADTSLPLERREPGGLGLHLVRRLVDSIAYEYSPERRESRVTFRKTAAASRGGGALGGSMLAIDNGPDGRVLVSGRLDAAQAPAAQAFLDRVEGMVTLDFGGVEYISSAGLGVLLKTQKRLQGTGGKLRLSGVRPGVRDVFVYAGFDQIIEIGP